MPRRAAGGGRRRIVGKQHRCRLVGGTESAVQFDERPRERATVARVHRPQRRNEGRGRRLGSPRERSSAECCDSDCRTTPIGRIDGPIDQALCSKPVHDVRDGAPVGQGARGKLIQRQILPITELLQNKQLRRTDPGGGLRPLRMEAEDPDEAPDRPHRRCDRVA